MGKAATGNGASRRLGGHGDPTRCSGRANRRLSRGAERHGARYRWGGQNGPHQPRACESRAFKHNCPEHRCRNHAADQPGDRHCSDRHCSGGHGARESSARRRSSADNSTSGSAATEYTTRGYSSAQHTPHFGAFLDHDPGGGAAACRCRRAAASRCGSQRC